MERRNHLSASHLRDGLKAKNGWLALGAGVLAYEILCPEGELLSEGVDRALERHPTLTRLAIGATALHLLNMLPEQYDPFHRGFNILKGLRQ